MVSALLASGMGPSWVSDSGSEAIRSVIASSVGNDTVARIAASNAAWFNRDALYSSQAALVNGQRCASDGSTDLAACGQGGRMCSWQFINIDRPCDAAAYLMMFQADRYLWCQTQLASLLAATPGGQQGVTNENDQPKYASAWADWCMKAMRLVSLSRWSTNINPGYLPDVNEMPAAAALLQEALTTHSAVDLRGVAAPSKVHADDKVPLVNQLLITMFKPTELVVPGPGTGFTFPTAASNFDPQLLVDPNLIVPQAGPHILDDTGRNMPVDPYTGRARIIATPAYEEFSSCCPIERATATAYPGTITCPINQVWGFGGPWPASWVPVTSADSNVSRRMYLWLNASLGFPYFVKNRGGAFYARPRVKINNTVVTTMATTPTDFWWGTGSLLIRLCQAWAQDVINMPFERMVANGLQAYLDTVAVIPEQYRNLISSNLAALRSALSEKAFADASAVIAPVFGAAAAVAAAIPVIGTIVGAVIAAIGALMEGLAKLFSGAMASGSFGWESACIPPPVMRMVKSATDAACDYDPSDGHLADVVSRVTAVQHAAAAGLPVAVWHDVAQTASGGTGPIAPFVPPDQQPSSSKVGLWVLGLAAVGIGGFVVYRLAR